MENKLNDSDMTWENVIEEIKKLKQRAEKAEMLLREVQPFCPVLEKNKISEFFKK